MSRNYLFSSESVTEGHPDKVCDQISDAIVDAIFEKEIQLAKEGYVSPSGEAANPENVRVACETLATTGLIMIAGEIRTQAYIDVADIARGVLRDIGYNRAKFGFDSETCGVLSAIHDQSADIALGVDESFEVQNQLDQSHIDPLERIGAGDQGMMFGYACNETSTLMPMPIYIAHRLAERLTEVRKDGTMHDLRPDGKTQVSIRYIDDKPVAVEKILISAQHSDKIAICDLKRQLIENVIAPVFEKGSIAWRDAEIFVNPTGRFVIGGPMGDTGLTGRKIIVDTYGGMGRHGGGAFSGKDCTKVDRSGAYAARWVAKNVVAAGLADRCEVQIAYAIGVAEPLSLLVETFGTETVSTEKIEAAVKSVFDLRPGAIIRDLDLRRPIYRKTAAYGHFGRELPEFSWELRNRVDELKAAVL
ncbi:MAG: methionine adenosyltransferase [Actinobacteria bacterium]|nr:methionine adenosyltransferase [Actinomycetota bacterium]